MPLIEKILEFFNESKHLMKRTLYETNYKHNINFYIHVYVRVCELSPNFN